MPPSSHHDCVPTQGKGLSDWLGAGPRALGEIHHSQGPQPTSQRAWPAGACLGLDATAPLTTVPVEASGTFNPPHRVLFILRSLYLCAIGPRSVLVLVMDTHHTSNCSPKPLYSWMQSTDHQWTQAHDLCKGRLPFVVAHSRALPGARVTNSTANCSTAHSIC